MNLNKEDVERIIRTLLKEELTLQVKNGGLAGPNTRTIELVLYNRVISDITLDISNRPECEG